jgi:hypothetical protein
VNPAFGSLLSPGSQTWLGDHVPRRDEEQDEDQETAERPSAQQATCLCPSVCGGGPLRPDRGAALKCSSVQEGCAQECLYADYRTRGVASILGITQTSATPRRTDDRRTVGIAVVLAGSP